MPHILKRWLSSRPNQLPSGNASSTSRPAPPPKLSSEPRAGTPSELSGNDRIQVPNNGDVFKTQGLKLAEAGNYEDAIPMYNATLQSNPSDTSVYLYRSFAYMLSNPPNLALAVRDADAAIQRDPTYWEAWQQKGELLGRTGEHRAAVEALENAVGSARGTDRFAAQRSLDAARAAYSQQPPAELPPIPTVSGNSSPQPSSNLLDRHPDRQNINRPPVQPPTTQISQSPDSSLSSPDPNTQNRLPSPDHPHPAINIPSLTTSPASSAPVTTGPREGNVSPQAHQIDQQSSQQSHLVSQQQLPSGFASPLLQAGKQHIRSPPAPSPLPVQQQSPAPSPASPLPPQSLPTPPLSPTEQQALSSSPIQQVAQSSQPSTLPQRQQPQSQPPTSPPASQPPPQRQQNTPTNNTPRSGRTPAVTRVYNSSTVEQTPASSLPLNSDDLIDFTEPPNEAPPQYTRTNEGNPPTDHLLTREGVESRLRQLQTSLSGKTKGSLALRPFTSVDAIDAAQLLYVGMTQSELTTRELGVPTYMHPSFNQMAVDSISYPGSTFLDMDCESTTYYEGKYPGTVTISGYSEEYREHQLINSPLLQLALEGPSCFNAVRLDRLADHIRRLQLQPTVEDDERLKQVMGLSQVECLQWGFHLAGNRQQRIDSICMALTKSLYNAPTRFINFSTARTFSNNTLGSPAQGIGLQNFLLQILLGAELLIRLRKSPAATSYRGIVTDNISALIVLSALWMENVTILGPSPALTASEPQYTLYARQHQRQAEGLIHFGEAMSWPFVDEARQYIENAYQNLIAGGGSVGFDICDWLFGLILPGKIFRHRIMSCLVYASPSIRSLNAAPYWDNGIVVGNKSYWPKRTVLGRVLGGLRNPKSVCGWIGPVPAPTGNIRGWVRLKARRIDVPTPVVRSANALETYGFNEAGSPEMTTESMVESITDPNEWIQPTPPTRMASDTSRSSFTGIELTLVPVAQRTTTNLNPNLPREEYRASLDFDVCGVRTRYTLYSNPIFIAAPPCVGTHVLHRRRAQRYLAGAKRVADLKETYLVSDQMLLINALGDGEEVVARAWCAERGRHAVIRRGGGCCFACAVAMTTGASGLGVNVLIWTQ